MDSFGSLILLPLAAGHALGLAAIVLIGSRGPSAPVAIIVVSAMSGVVLPPVSSVMRTLYPRLLDHDAELIRAAYGLDSVASQLVFIAGPLVPALFIAVGSPAAALIVSAVATVAGTATFLLVLGGAGRRKPRTLRDTRRHGALRAPGIRTIVLASVPIGCSYGAIEVAVPAFSEAHHVPAVAGLLIACWGGGALIGGLAYGALPRRAPLHRVHERIIMLVPLGYLLVVVAPSPLTMALLLVPAGALLAPMAAAQNELIGLIAPSGAEVEAYSWPFTSLVSGSALGAALGGIVAESSGWQPTVMLAVAAAALGAAMIVLRRSSLVPSCPREAVAPCAPPVPGP